MLEKLLELVMNANSASLTLPNQEQIAGIRGQVVEALQKKYPNSGVTLKGAG